MAFTPQEDELAALKTTYQKEGGSPWRWYICGLLFLATTINYLDRNVFSLLEPALHNIPFMQWDDAHPEIFNAHYSTILAWFQVAYAVAFLVVGRFIDRVGTKIGYAVSILIWSIAAASHSFVGSVFGFIIARVALGFGEAGNFPAAIKATTEWFPTEERALATGIFNSGANVASFLGPYIVAWIVGAYGWKSAFITTGLAGLLWLVLWIPFPYNRRRRDLTMTQENLQVAVGGDEAKPRLGFLLKARGLYGFCTLKFMTDPIWWFYLFWLPKYFNERFGFSMKQNALPLLIIYGGSSIGSILGGYLSGYRMKRGATVNAGRKFALLACAVCSLPVIYVPFSHNIWVDVALLALATAAHQGFSANVFSTATDMFPGTAVSTVVGIGGTAGAIGGALFTKFTGIVWVSHPILIFGIAATAYVASLLIFHLIVPRLGENLHPPLVEPTNP
ncbi:MAG: MFS transporter [Acidobacteria bacterium]|nr:MFS transporter [Acidobacteriota bacterium]